MGAKYAVRLPGDWSGFLPFGPNALKTKENLVSHPDDHTGTRRDFLYYATGGAGAVAAGAAVWPLVNQMNPSADVQALSSIRVDVSGVEPGTQITVKWLGKPVFIRHRTGEELQAQSQEDIDISSLPDPSARNVNLADPDAPATDANRTIPSPEGEAGVHTARLAPAASLGTKLAPPGTRSRQPALLHGVPGRPLSVV